MCERDPGSDSCEQRAWAKLVPALSPAHRRFEVDLTATTSVAVQHRIVWLERFGNTEDWFCAAGRGGSNCQAGFAVTSLPARALPGHRLLRVERFCPPGNVEITRAMVESLYQLALQDWRVLSVRVGLCCHDQTLRTSTADLLARTGFVRSEAPRSYEHTLVLDLEPDEPEILAGLDSKARRDIRVISRFPVQVMAIEDPTWAERIQALLNESMSRTGGRAVRQDWAARLDFSRTFPSLAHTVGLFRTDVTGQERLVAFASAFHHGEYAHYDAAGTTRLSTLRMPMSYALLWDLIRWAKAHRAKRFDLGGVTLGHLRDGGDALGGISDFKRYFTKKLVEVGSEWVLEPRPRRARFARVVSGLAQQARARWHS